MTIIRYGLGREYTGNTGSPAIIEQSDGEFVRYADHMAIVSELQAENVDQERIVVAQAETIGKLRTNPHPPTSAQAADMAKPGKTADEYEQELADIGNQCNALQNALAFYMPNVPEADHPLHARVAQDAYLLCGYDGSGDEEPSAHALGLISLSAQPAASVEPVAQDAINGIAHALDWIGTAPHGDNCFVSEHYEGDPGSGCNCGKDGAENALLRTRDVLAGCPQPEICKGDPCEFCIDTGPVAAQPSVPDGWKLVPVEPTPEMLDAGSEAGNGHDWSGPKDVYGAMLAVSPAPSADGRNTPVGRANDNGTVTWFDPIPEGGAFIYAGPADEQEQRPETTWTDEQGLHFSMSGKTTKEQVALVQTVIEGIGLKGYFDALVGWWRGIDNNPVDVPLLKAIVFAYKLGERQGADNQRKTGGENEI